MDYSSESMYFIMQQMESYSKMGINISPYLSGIQTINGKTPGEKYREINRIVANIVHNNQQTNADQTCINIPTTIPASIQPLVRAHAAKTLKSNEAVIEALKSENIPVANQALRARWFFHGSNEIVCASYFLENIFPHVSELMRLRIIKLLSRGVVGYELKAKDFFNACVKSYGLEVARPFLFACSKEFIEVKAIELNLTLKYEELMILYKKYPELTVGWIKSNVNWKRNTSNRNFPSIETRTLSRFLPQLIRRHIHDFIEICEKIKYHSMKISNRNTKIFFKNALEYYIKHPKPLLHLFPLYVVCKHITTQNFEIMFANLFPAKIENFHLEKMINYMNYYPKEKRWHLLTRQFKLKYNIELEVYLTKKSIGELTHLINIIPADTSEKLFINLFSSKNVPVSNILEFLEKTNYSRERKINFIKTVLELRNEGKNWLDEILNNTSITLKQKILQLLPADERSKQAKKIIETCKIYSDEYYKWYTLIPLKESFSTFKEAIAKCSVDTNRLAFIIKMFNSYALDNDKEDLLQILDYCNKRHKNEKIEILSELLRRIPEIVDLKTLEKPHWGLIVEIFHRANVKNELVKFVPSIINKYMNAVIHYILVKRDSENEMVSEYDEDFLNKIFDIIVDYNLEFRGVSNWIILPNINIYSKIPKSKLVDTQNRLKLQKFCFDKLLKLLALKYPRENSIWKGEQGFDKKKRKVTDITSEILNLNKIISQLNEKYSDFAFDVEKISINDYPWLKESIDDLLNDEKIELDLGTKHNLKMFLKNQIPEYYDQSNPIKSNEDEIASVNTGSAVIKLKRNQNHVLTHWDSYLERCKQLLKRNSKRGGAAARRFILATKWHEGIPEKMIKRCLHEIKEENNLKVLGIMLEGEVFGKLVTPFAPNDSAVDLTRFDMKGHYKAVSTLLPGMNLTSPPVPMDIIGLFCQGEYMRLAIQAVTHTSKRVPKSKMINFSQQLVRKPVSVKKHGIQLLFKQLSPSELYDFVKGLWAKEKHASIRGLITNLIKTRFEAEPNDQNWDLMEICIDSVSHNDKVPLQVICNFTKIHNEYVSVYIEKIIDKIENLPTVGRTEQELKAKYLASILNCVHLGIIKYLSKEFIIKIVEKYCFMEPDSFTIHVLEAAETFAKTVFSQPHSNKYYKYSFNS